MEKREIKIIPPPEEGKIKLLVDKLREFQKNPDSQKLDIHFDNNCIGDVIVESVGADYIEITGREKLTCKFIIPIKEITYLSHLVDKSKY